MKEILKYITTQVNIYKKEFACQKPIIPTATVSAYFDDRTIGEEQCWITCEKTCCACIRCAYLFINM